MEFKSLFQSGKIGTLEVSNRVVKAPQSTAMSNMDGSVSERLIRHYKKLAEGGVGLVIVEYAYVDDYASKSAHCQLGISSNEHIPGLAWLASTIKETGAKAGIQIEHCGRQKFLGTPPMLAPSRIPWPTLYEKTGMVPEEMNLEQIEDVIEAFGDAALRAQMAGFDLVEIHGAHGYLITNFLSPHTNKRLDLYGGSLENRMRFLKRIVENVRKKVGPDYPVTVRLSGSDYEPDGLTIEDTVEISKVLETLGIDAIHVSGGDHHMMVHQVTPMALSVCHNTWAAEIIKKEVNIPVIASGSITLPRYGEEIISSGKADFIGLGRPLWADPDWALKAKEGRSEDVRPCIRCNDGCLERTFYFYRAVSCTVNPAVGREGELDIAPAEQSKKVAVVGGGPAGMEAARVAALRGHDVTIYEKRELGGALIEASAPEFKTDLRPLHQYYLTQLQKLDIQIQHEEATAETIQNENYDVVILATGAKPIPLNLPGQENTRVVHALDVLSNQADTGQKVLVIGGGMVGTETALHLAEEHQRDVVLVEMADQIMGDVGHSEAMVYFDKIKKDKIKVLTGEKVTEITHEGIIVQNKKGQTKTIGADTVVIAAGFTPNNTLSINISTSNNVEVYSIGDCVKPAKFLDAIHQAFHLARKI